MNRCDLSIEAPITSTKTHFISMSTVNRIRIPILFDANSNEVVQWSTCITRHLPQGMQSGSFEMTQLGDHSIDAADHFAVAALSMLSTESQRVTSSGFHGFIRHRKSLL
jgi:hypothetical protein